MGIENVVYRGFVEASSGGPVAPDGTVLHNEIHLRHADGGLTRLANVSVSAGVDMVIERSVIDGEPLELWAKSPGAGEVSWCYAARTPTLEVYSPNGIVEVLNRQGIRLAAWGAFCAVAVGTVFLSPLALFAPFLWVASALSFSKAGKAAPLPEADFLNGVGTGASPRLAAP